MLEEIIVLQDQDRESAGHAQSRQVKVGFPLLIGDAQKHKQNFVWVCIFSLIRNLQDLVLLGKKIVTYQWAEPTSPVLSLPLAVKHNQLNVAA